MPTGCAKGCGRGMAMGSERIFAVHPLCTSCLTSVQTEKRSGATAPVRAKGPDSPVDIWASWKGTRV